MIHGEAHQLLAAGAALDDLAADELVAFQANRTACPECAALSGELDGVLADLALVTPERSVPAGLLGEIRLAIDAEAASTAPARLSALPALRLVPNPVAQTATRRSAAGRGWTRLPSRSGLAGLAVAAAFALVAVGIGARAVGLQDELDRSTAQVALLRSQVAGQGAVMSAAVDPHHVSVALTAEPLAPDAAAVVVFVPGTTSSYLVAEHLPATPPGLAYQLWYADATGVHGLETLRYDGSGTFVAPLGVDLASSTAVMVTLEPAGGAQGSPGPQVVFGNL